jgi:hypothetical protein
MRCLDIRRRCPVTRLASAYHARKGVPPVGDFPEFA